MVDSRWKFAVLVRRHAHYEGLRTAARTLAKHPSGEQIIYPMNNENGPRNTTKAKANDAASPSVSLRAMHADALREVMADPRKALAEHDPWLAALLCSCSSAAHLKP